MAGGQTDLENMKVENRRRKYELLRAQLEMERSTFLTHWRDLAQFVSPRRARFSVVDTNRGDRRNGQIINSTATLALRTLKSGMMGGITSPARPWFRLTTDDPDLNDKASVKLWLDQVSQRMITIFLKSNLYNVLPIIYGDMGQEGTSAVMVEEDFDEVVRYYPFPIGTYMIGTDHKGRVNVFIRDFRMTVKQMIEKWGDQDPKSGEPDWSKFSSGVKNLWENDEREVWIDICHVIMPNDQYYKERLDSKFKKFISVYYERGSAGPGSNNYIGPEDDRFLSEMGYDYFPVLCPRWEVAAEDAYGTSCPGMDALGDVKQLQLMERRIMQAVDKTVNPPMVAPTAMRNSKTSSLPGDVTYLDLREGQSGFKPAYEVKFSIAEAQQKTREIEDRIKRAYYEDLFLLISNIENDVTATEVNEKKEEKLLVLGPVLEQLNQDLLDPNIDIVFELGLRQRKFPPPPKELHGIPLKIEYLSIMAQAQKVAGISGVDRYVQFIVNNSEAIPGLADRIDPDELTDVYADMTSVPPQINRSADVMAQIRKQKAQAQQAQQQAELQNQQSQTARNLAQAPIDGNNALSQLIPKGWASDGQS